MGATGGVGTVPGAEPVRPVPTPRSDLDQGVEASLVYRASSVVYQAAALVMAALPLLAAPAASLLLLDGRSWWSLLATLLAWALGATLLPAVVYAVTRPGWTSEPSARRRAVALWRGWRGSVAQFGPVALLSTAFVLGMVTMTATAGAGAGSLRLVVLAAVGVVAVLAGRAGTICALFTFPTGDLLTLAVVLTVRDAAGTLFLAALGSVAVLLLAAHPLVLVALAVPLCAACAPATRAGRRILIDQFTAPSEP